MRKMIGILAFCLIFSFCIGAVAYSAPADIGELVDNFYKATDLQREQILKDNSAKVISASGTVNNVGEYDFFDVVNDIKGIYYQVTTEQQKTKNNVPYQVIFLFKDRDKIEGLNKGQSFQKDGQVIRIMDERLQVAVWLFCGELDQKDKALFK